jgi:hypothetical protein
MQNLRHARHNKETCEFLRNNGSGKHNDWIITTAFYSALHYVNAELFPNSYECPRTGNMKTFHDFNSLYKLITDNSNKHRYLQFLVEEFISDENIIDAFRTLKDNCWTARYKKYQMDNDITELCYSCLEEISEFCEPVDFSQTN